MSAAESLHKPTAPQAARRDYRPLAVVGVFALIAGLGYLVRLAPGNGVVATANPPPAAASAFAGLGGTSRDARSFADEREATPPAQGTEKPDTALAGALNQAEALIGAGKYDDAIRQMNSVRPLAGNSAQAYRMLGRALLGKGDYATARDFLGKAIDLDPALAGAYFDHATASEGLGDLESALGGMRSYLHLETNNDPQRLKIAQARAAIWEWEAKLGRGAWGPTKGIPPGFTAEMLKRDGKGVGVMMPKPETLRPDGTMDFEIKSGERQPQLWKK